MKVKIYGASDDLLEVEGDLREEFNPSTQDDDNNYLVFGDGSVFKIVYDDDGIWRISTVVKGTSSYTKTEGVISEDTNDIVELDGDLKWCIFCRSAIFIN